MRNAVCLRLIQTTIWYINMNKILVRLNIVCLVVNLTMGLVFRDYVPLLVGLLNLFAIAIGSIDLEKK